MSKAAVHRLKLAKPEIWSHLLGNVGVSLWLRVQEAQVTTSEMPQLKEGGVSNQILLSEDPSPVWARCSFQVRRQIPLG